MKTRNVLNQSLKINIVVSYLQKYFSLVLHTLQGAYSTYFRLTFSTEEKLPKVASKDVIPKVSILNTLC